LTTVQSAGGATCRCDDGCVDRRLTDLAADDVVALSARDRAQRLVRLRAWIDQLEVEFARTLASSDAHGDGERLDGARSTASWLRDRFRLAPGDAAERVRVAKACYRGAAPLHEAATAVSEGRATYDQLRAIAYGVKDLAAEPARRAAELLTDLAASADASQVRNAAKHLRYVVDPDGADRSQAQMFEARRASFAPMLDGMYRLELFADPEGAAVLDAGMTALSGPASADDRRSVAQRRYDAILTIFGRTLASGELPAVAGTPPQILVTCTPDALAGARGAPPAAWSDGSPMSPRTLERISCDAAIARVVFGPAGELLEYGRTRRLFTAGQRKALFARDRGCRFPGCTAPWTQAHHVVPWQHGGRTDVDAAVLVCEIHHHRVHEEGWQVRVVDESRGTNGPVRWSDPQGEARATSPVGLRWPLPVKVWTALSTLPSDGAEAASSEDRDAGRAGGPPRATAGHGTDVQPTVAPAPPWSRRRRDGPARQ
jgi:hypothetical protein